MLLSTAQCGKKNTDLSVRMIPEQPFVYDTSFVIDGPGEEDITIEKAWLMFRLEVKNNSDATMTVNAIKFEVTDEKGGKTTVDFSPAGISGELSDTVFAVIAPRETVIIGEDGGLYASGLPSVSEGNISSTRMSGTLTVYGWYGNELNPEKPLRSEFSFSTQ